MKLALPRRTAVAPVVTAALALGVVACAADPSKELKSAEANLTSARVEAADEQARLERKHAQELAEAKQKAITEDERVELLTEQREELAEAKAEGKKSIAEAQEEAINARAAMMAERAKFEADARERLTKADARVKEAKSKSGRLSGGDLAQYKAELTTFEGKRIEARKRLSALEKATDEEWNEAKAKLDKTLDHIEAAVDRLEEDL